MKTRRGVPIILASWFILFPNAYAVCDATGKRSVKDSGRGSTCMGPLSVQGHNPRYFSDSVGRPVYLTGSHTWENFQDIDPDDRGAFDYRGYLDVMQHHKHNFMRLWVWEQAAWMSSTQIKVRRKVVFGPLPYMRTGPGRAIDGGLRFDLGRFNEVYFQRMRSRVLEARDHGIYVGVMMFQGFSIEAKGAGTDESTMAYLGNVLSRFGLGAFFEQTDNPWRGHPFNARNNINGIDGDPDGRGDGRDVHTLRIPEITRLQEEYAKKVIDTLGDLDNILWEIANESHADSTPWQYHMIDFIHEYEKSRRTQHPVLMTVQWPDGENAIVFNSRAEAVSPNGEGGVRDNAAIARGDKVIIVDSDHLWGIGGDWKWVWKSFLMGMNPIFMDPFTVREFQNHPTHGEWELVRRNMGATRAFSERVNLVDMVPRPELVSSGYCLAHEGKEYLVYAPSDGSVEVDLSRVDGEFEVEWFDPVSGSSRAGHSVPGGTSPSLRVPFANDAIIHIYRRISH